MHLISMRLRHHSAPARRLRPRWFVVATLLALALLVALPPRAHAKPASAPLRLEVFTAGDDAFDVNATLIYGKTEALLVDALFHSSDAARLADRIAAHGLRLKAIFITHPDDDHYLGLAVLHQRFPDTPIYMTPTALAEFKRTVDASLAGQKKYLPADTPDSVPMPQPLPANRFLIDGRAVEVLPDLQGDYPDIPANSALWIPSLHAVVAGDLVFDGIHPWLAGSTEATRAAWRASLDRLAALHPKVVVAGHKKTADGPDSPAALAFLKQYLADFDATKKSAANAAELESAMKQKYPGLGQERFLALAAKSAFRK